MDLLIPAILYCYLVVNATLGINFGYHWDEEVLTGYVDEFQASGPQLPRAYLYPSVCYFIVLLLSFAYRSMHALDALATAPLTGEIGFTLFARSVFIYIACLSVVWTYALALKVTRQRWCAVLAGLIFCSSFEFSYHSRWVATDLIAVQFAMLSLLLLFTDMRFERRIILSAVVAGIAAGTKYTAGIFCLNIALAILVENRPWSSWQAAITTLRQWMLSGLVSVVTFVVTTPGSIFHYEQFNYYLHYQHNMYAGHHIVSDTFAAGWQHLAKMMEYFSLTLFSPIATMSVLVFLLAIAGGTVAAVRKQWNLCGIFLTLVCYTALLSQFQVMIPRNVLFVLPCCVVLASYALLATQETLGKKGVVLSAAIMLCFAAPSMVWVAQASWTVFTKNRIDMKQQLNQFLAGKELKHFVFSGRVREMMKPALVLENGPLEADMNLVFLKSEVSDMHYSKVGYGKYKTLGSGMDINFDYYPNWAGPDRVVIIKLADANPFMLNDLKLLGNNDKQRHLVPVFIPMPQPEKK